MIADDRVVENIKKLQELGMSHDEIIENLVRMGLSKDESTELIKKAEVDINKNKKPVESTTKVEDKKVIKVEEKSTTKVEDEIPKTREIPDNFFENDELPNQVVDVPETDLFADEMNNISKGLEMDTLEDMSKNESSSGIIDKATINSINVGSLNQDYKPEIDFKDSTSENIDIWQRGIITTINMKLTELENKQKTTEEYLKKKMDENTTSLQKLITEELNKLNSVQASSRQLLLAKIGNDIKAETDKSNAKVLIELTKFKVLEARMGNELAKIESEKNSISALSLNLEDRSKEIKEVSELTVKQNDLLTQKTEESINKIITTLTTKLNTKIKEINNTLALQSRITEGLVKNTQNSIDLEIKKIIEFEEGIKKQINPQQIYDKLSELDTFKTQLANRYDERFEKVKIEFLAKAREAMKNEISDELRELKHVRDTIAQRTDPEIINKKLEELRIFEEHLLVSVDEKISQSLKIYESSLNSEFKEKIKEIERLEKGIEKDLNAVNLIQEKMDELNKFKEQFIAVIDQNIEVMNVNMQALNERVKQINGNK